MINERIEFQQYTFDIKSYKPKSRHAMKLRLNYRNLCNHLSGIERAMTIVARYYYYTYEGELPQYEGELPQRTCFVKEVLKAWVGADAEIPKELEHLRNWLAEYIWKLQILPKLEKMKPAADSTLSEPDKKKLKTSIQALQTADNLKVRLELAEKLCALTKGQKDLSAAAVSVHKLAAALEDLAKKRKTFAKRMLLPYIDDDEANKWGNDYKKITYDKILADAINDGPLTHRLLVCTGDMFGPIQKTRGNLLEADRDRIQKLLAAFLLNHTGQNAVVIKKADIANWCEGNPKLDKEDYGRYLYHKEPLFTMQQVGNNVVKLVVHPQYLDEIKPQLIPVEKLPEIDLQEFQVFEDMGSGMLLKPRVGKGR